MTRATARCWEGALLGKCVVWLLVVAGNPTDAQARGSLRAATTILPEGSGKMRGSKTFKKQLRSYSRICTLNRSSLIFQLRRDVERIGRLCSCL